jgi:quaternary ammonium compound-resistance protein SugE
MTAAWTSLFFAGLLEIAWMYFMKASDGFTKPLATAGFAVSSFASFWLLSYAVRTIPIGTGYAIWTGIGAVGAVVLGIVVYKEPATLLRIFFTLLILGGIIGLKFNVSGSQP